MSASALRPLSTILCTVHPAPKQHTLSASGDSEYPRAHSEPAITAALNAVAPLDGSPTLVGEDDMPIATSDDASNTPNKMHAYARASGPEAVSNGAPVSGAKRPNRADTPQVFSSVAARQTIGDGARLPVPAPKPTTRFGSITHHARSQSGAPNQSPPHVLGPSSPVRRARSNSNDRGAGGAAAALWAPSVLSDSEFNSPSTDPERSRIARFQAQNSDHPALAQQPPSWNPHQSGHFSEFIIGNDGMMKVRPVQNGTSNHRSSHHPQDEHHRENHQSLDDPFSPLPPLQSQLPMRDSQPRKSYPDHQGGRLVNTNNLVDEDERRGAIPPTFESARTLDRPKHEPSNGRRNPIFDDDDDDDDDFDMASEPEQVTPRGRDKHTTKTFLDSPLAYSSPAKEDRNSRKRRFESCDYDDQALSSMSYADLKAQPFDVDPTTAEASPRAAAASRTAENNSLPARLEFYKAKGEAEQQAFFGGLSVAEWDGAGDWFVEQFAAAMQRVRDGRRKRREVVARFEGEIAEREEGVRARSDGVRRKLDRMKRDGLKVVADE